MEAYVMKYSPELIEEMRQALIGAATALKATEIFMAGREFQTEELKKIIKTLDDLNERVDEAEQEN
ncbi:MAG: hypothetical protein IJS40_01245 [Synergistaceae bacterium]|nr:hypothetical protein [Synergistaceae bacterium]